MVAYYRAPGCDSVTIADVLPILSKINYYEDEYVIGEMLIWDTGSQSPEPNNCAMVRVIIYNDGWICAWFDKTTQNQVGIGGAQYVNSTTLSGWGSTFEYEDRFNGCQLKITSSTDPECPTGTIFNIRNTDHNNGQITVHNDRSSNDYHFNTGYSYDADIYMTNGNLIWWGHYSSSIGYPSNLSNRLYRAIYELWVSIRTSSNSTNWSPANASLVYMYDSQTAVYTNETTDFNDIGVDDCQVLPIDEVINDTFYIGSSNKFNGVTITMGIPGIGSGITWEYWNGSAWTSLSCIDGSSGFTTGGELTFDPPDSWSKVIVNGNDYYWIRARVTTASYSTTPILTQGQLYLQNNIGYLETELGVYNYEFTGANYVLLCGICASGGIGIINSYFYNTVLPGKTIYDHEMNFGFHYTDTVHSTSQGKKFYLNGNLIYTYPVISSSYYSYGYIIKNITTIDYSPGIQNVFNMWGQSTGTTGGNKYMNMGSVLIVS